MDPSINFPFENLEALLGEDGELDSFLGENNRFPAFLDQLWASFFSPDNLSSLGPEHNCPVGDSHPLSSVPDQLLNDTSPCTSSHKNRISSLAARNLQCKKNLLADKRRREILNKQFLALAALLPGLTKTDKISVMRESVKYINQLRKEHNKLKEHNPNQAVVVKKSGVFEEQNGCSIHERSSVCNQEQLPEIEVRMYEKNILLTIRCQKDKLVLSNIHAEIAKLNLTVISCDIMSFAGVTYEIIILAEMDTDFSLREKCLVKRLRSALAIHEKLNSSIRSGKNI
ncbi:transcription factor bHLH25-like [Coffea eugenioides]|uniref:Transcription factor bHLH25-like n=1 Tax=Coffea arabica TaxID=13443 RepID=A0ABM4USD3_COFAR|nr:transcription factor bHLH25-like [Coffea eugenioides]